MSPQEYLQILQSAYRAYPDLTETAEIQINFIRQRDQSNKGWRFDHVTDPNFRSKLTAAWAEAATKKDLWVSTHVEALRTATRLPQDVLKVIRSDELAIGTLETADFNASAIRVPMGRGHVIALQSGLSMLMYAVSRTILATVEIATEDGEQRHRAVVDHHQAAKCIGDRLSHYIQLGIPIGSSPRLGAAHLTTASLLAAMAERFVLCHEIAHVKLGHLDKTEQTRAVPDDWSEASEIALDHSKEFEADWYGLFYLVMSQGDLHHIQFAIAGAMLFLHTAEALEQFGCENHVTHPPAGVRRSMLVEVVRTLSSSLGIPHDVLMANAAAQETWMEHIIPGAIEQATKCLSPLDDLIDRCAESSIPNYAAFTTNILRWLAEGAPPKLCKELSRVMKSARGELEKHETRNTMAFHRYKLLLSLADYLPPEIWSRIDE